jgi:hypothetical protein
VEYIIRDAPLSEVGGTLNLEQLKRGQWIAEFPNT